MLLTKDSPATHLPPARAEEIARDLRAADEDGWTFRAVHAPGGAGEYSFVEVLDEDGELIGRM